MKLAKDLYGSRHGQLAVIIGCGPSIAHAQRHATLPHPNVFRIALNAAIRKIPAEYWFWIDGDAYEGHRGHPNAVDATRVGVEHFSALYDPDVWVWERCRSDLMGDLKKGNLVHRATSLIGAISFSMRLGAVGAVLVGCDNRIDEKSLEEKRKLNPSKDWRKYDTFTFARINEALRMRDKWLPKEFLIADASWDRDRMEFGDLYHEIPKTRLNMFLEWWKEVGHGYAVGA